MKTTKLQQFLDINTILASDWSVHSGDKRFVDISKSPCVCHLSYLGHLMLVFEGIYYKETVTQTALGQMLQHFINKCPSSVCSVGEITLLSQSHGCHRCFWSLFSIIQIATSMRTDATPKCSARGI